MNQLPATEPLAFLAIYILGELIRTECVNRFLQVITY